MKKILVFFLAGMIFVFLVREKAIIGSEKSLAKSDLQTEILNSKAEEATHLSKWHPSSTPFPQNRKAWEWPFDSKSIWNLPLPSNAVYQPANLKSGVATSAELELLYQTSEQDPLTRIYAPGSWTHRCDGTKSPTGNPAAEIYIHFPRNIIIPDADPPSTPNNSAAILQPDGKTIASIASGARCEPGGPLYGWYGGKQSIYGAGTYGTSGGSGLSTLGGTIRLGELTNDLPIRHALRVNVWASKYLYFNPKDPKPGYRWPATVADNYAVYRYGGTNPNLEMGTLLAIPPKIKPEDLGLKSIPALKLFYALQNYGAYVADDTAWNVTAFSIQQNAPEEFEQVYGYKYETNNLKSQWFKEYYALVESLHIVVNNSPTTNTIDEKRLVTLAPPLIYEENNTDNYE